MTIMMTYHTDSTHPFITTFHSSILIKRMISAVIPPFCKGVSTTQSDSGPHPSISLANPTTIISGLRTTLTVLALSKRGWNGKSFRDSFLGCRVQAGLGLWIQPKLHRLHQLPPNEAIPYGWSCHARASCRQSVNRCFLFPHYLRVYLIFFLFHPCIYVGSSSGITSPTYI